MSALLPKADTDPQSAKSALGQKQTFVTRSLGQVSGHDTCTVDGRVCVQTLGALAAGARDDLAEQLPRRAVKFLKLHLLDRSEIVRAGVDGDAGQ
jgi:hypothetical protein